MKSKPLSEFDTLSRRFRPRPIYFEDLQRVVALAARRDFKVEVTDSLNDFDDIDDVRINLVDKVANLTLSFPGRDSKYLKATVRFTADGIHVTTNNTEALIALWHDLLKFFEDHIPWYSRLARPLSWLFAGSVAGLIGPRIASGALAVNIFLGCQAACYVAAMCSAYYLLVSSVVHLRRKSEASGILSRYGEKVVLLIIGGLITLAVKWLGEHM